MSKTMNAVFAGVFVVLGATAGYGELSGTLNGAWELLFLLLAFAGLYWVVKVAG